MEEGGFSPLSTSMISVVTQGYGQPFLGYKKKE